MPRTAFRTRWLSHLVAVLALVIAFLGGLAVQKVLAHDENLDTALAALEKSSVLLEAALANDAVGFPNKTGHEIAKHLERAIQDVADASDEILRVIALEDAP